MRGDTGLAAVLLVVVSLGELAATPRSDLLWGLAFSVALVGCVPFRRRAWAAALVVVGVLCLAQLLVLDRPVSGDVVALLMLYTVLAYGPGPVLGASATACMLLGAGAAAVRWDHAEHGVSLGNAVVSTLAIVFLAATLGAWQRSRRAQLATLRERNRLLAVERDQQAAVGAAIERARIARELHDVIAHSLSVVVVQADGAAAGALQRPEAAAAALRTIAATGRDALGQMRRLLGVLREGQDRDGAARAPQPGAAQLDDLLANVVNAGLPAGLTVRGAVRPLPATIDTAVYRVAQEALTNVLKHAGEVSRVEVVLRYRERAIELSVRDDGRSVAAADDGHGHGLAGMRERVELHGGTLVTGPRAGGGFSVEAIVPVAEPAAIASAGEPAAIVSAGEPVPERR